MAAMSSSAVAVSRYSLRTGNEVLIAVFRMSRGRRMPSRSPRKETAV